MRKKLTFIAVLVVAAFICSYGSSKEVGEINKVDKGKREVHVSTKSGLRLNIGERLQVATDDGKVVLEVTFPMLTFSKCKIKGKGRLSYLSKGMKVYRYSKDEPAEKWKAGKRAIYGPGAKIYYDYLETGKFTSKDKEETKRFVKRHATLDGNPQLSVKEANDSIKWLKKTYAEEGHHWAWATFGQYAADFYEKFIPELQQETSVKIQPDWLNYLIKFNNKDSLKTSIAKTKHYLRKLVALAEKYHYYRIKIQISDKCGLAFSFYDYENQNKPTIEFPSELKIIHKPFNLKLLDKKLKTARLEKNKYYREIIKTVPKHLQKKVTDIFLKTAMRDGKPALSKEEINILKFYFDNKERKLTKERLDFIDYDITDLYLRD